MGCFKILGRNVSMSGYTKHFHTGIKKKIFIANLFGHDTIYKMLISLNKKCSVSENGRRKMARAVPTHACWELGVAHMCCAGKILFFSLISIQNLCQEQTNCVFFVIRLVVSFLTRFKLYFKAVGWINKLELMFWFLSFEWRKVD